MLPFSFEDRSPEKSFGSGFAATNEEPRLIREMIRSFRKGVGIAASGDVTFLALLPKCQESLTLVDHNYSSLRAFCVKALLLATLGPSKTRALLTSVESKAVKDAILRVEEHLPSCLRATPLAGQYRAGSCQDLMTSYNFHEVRREWHLAEVPVLSKAAKNLHKITLIHGDLLLDTKDRAPYDLLYLSNALEHQGRSGTYLSASIGKLSTLLTPAAPICWIEMSGSQGRVGHSVWQDQKQVGGFRTSSKYNVSLNLPPIPVPSPIEAKVAAKVASGG